MAGPPIQSYLISSAEEKVAPCLNQGRAFPAGYTDLVDTLLEDSENASALSVLDSLVSENLYPPPGILQILLQSPLHPKQFPDVTPLHALAVLHRTLKTHGSGPFRDLFPRRYDSTAKPIEVWVYLRDLWTSAVGNGEDGVHLGGCDIRLPFIQFLRMLLKDDISRTEPLENSILGQSLGLHRRLNLKAPLDVFEEILEETDPKGTITVEIGEWISEISSLSKSGQFDLLTYWREVCSMFNRIDDTAAFLMIESIEPATARFAISDILLSRLSYVSRKSNGQTRLSASNFPTKARKHLEAVPIDQNWEAYITLITIILGTIDVELNEDTKRALHDGVEFIRDRAPKKAKVHTQTLVDFVDLIWPTA